MFISLKRKNTILEMASKSLILSKLDHQMSKSWKRIAAHELETTSKFDLLKNWVPDCSAQDRNLTKSYYTQNMSSMWSSSPVGKIKIFLPDPILVGWLKILHLINFSMWMLQCRVCLFFKEILYSPDWPDSPNSPKLKIHLWWQHIYLFIIFQGIAPKHYK